MAVSDEKDASRRFGILPRPTPRDADERRECRNEVLERADSFLAAERDDG